MVRQYMLSTASCAFRLSADRSSLCDLPALVDDSSAKELAREFGIEDSDEDDVKIEGGVRTGFSSSSTSPSYPVRKASPSASRIGSRTSTTPKSAKSSKSTPTRSVKKQRTNSMTEFFTPERAPRRKSSDGGRTSASTNKDSELKPFTPSSTIQSSMNASLVFDMVTSLSTNDPGVAIATLRSMVVLGKEYPSDLLYTELIDRIQSSEAVAYADAAAIYAALVFVFDKAATCSVGVTFPSRWEPLATALQDVSDEDKPLDEAWRRNLLVIQFYTYCFKQDLRICRERYEKLEQATWIERTRVFDVLQQDPTAVKARARARGKSKAKMTRNNNLIMQAIGWSLQLWKRVYDGDCNDKSVTKAGTATGTEASSDPNFFRQEGEEACMAVLRFIEMLFLCTDQEENTLHRIQAGLMELSRPTRMRFAYGVQSPSLQTGLSATVIGLSLKSRSTETEWYECNAVGRVFQSMNPGKCRLFHSTETQLVIDCRSIAHRSCWKYDPDGQVLLAALGQLPERRAD